MPEPTLADVLAATLALHRDVRRLLDRDSHSDPAMLPLLLAVSALYGNAAFSAAELAADHRLRDVTAAITGGRGDPAKRLGRYLAQRAGREAGGFRLVQIKLEFGCWLYAISRV